MPSNVLGLTLRNFSTGSLLQTSQLDGDLACVLGADAVCQPRQRERGVGLRAVPVP